MRQVTKVKSNKGKKQPSEQKPGGEKLALIPTSTEDVGQDQDVNCCHGGLG